MVSCLFDFILLNNIDMSRPQEKKKPFFSCCAGEEDKKGEAYVDVSDKKHVPVYAPPSIFYITQPYLLHYLATACSTSSKNSIFLYGSSRIKQSTLFKLQSSASASA